MKRIIRWVVLALIGMTLLGSTAEASTVNSADGQAQNHAQRPRNTRRSNTATVDPQEYAQKRLDAIAKAAELTEDEKSIVAIELTKYDNNRLLTWVETRRVHQDLAQLGAKATDKDYRDSLTKLANLSDQRQKASQDFIKALSQKLSPQKAYLVYSAQRNFNANTGRMLRED